MDKHVAYYNVLAWHNKYGQAIRYTLTSTMRNLTVINDGGAVDISVVDCIVSTELDSHVGQFRYVWRG